MRVRIFEKRRNGTFYRTTWVPGRGRDHASLGTRDRNEAERLGRMLLAELLRQEETTRSERLMLGALWKRYETECATYLDNKASTRRDDAARVKLLLAFFGEHCDGRTLTARDQSAYAASRKAGGVVLADGTKTRPVRTRSVEMDLVLLHTMLRWATTVRQPNGSRLLDANPLAGVRREREQNPTRPVASWERFQRTRAAMQALQEEAAGRPDARVTRGRAEAVPHAIRGDYGMDLRWRAQARPADGSTPLRQVAARRGEEGQAPEARRWAVAPVSPEGGD